MKIRRVHRSDHNHIQQLYLETFDDNENETVAQLAVELLETNSSPDTLSLVAEIDDTLVGHIAFSPIKSRESDKMLGYILAPLAVNPAHQKQKIGSQLVQRGLLELSQSATGVVIVYGDPNYYGRFGFTSDLAENYIAPYPLQYPSGWLALVQHPEQIIETREVITCVPALDRPELW